MTLRVKYHTEREKGAQAVLQYRISSDLVGGCSGLLDQVSPQTSEGLRRLRQGRTAAMPGSTRSFSR